MRAASIILCSISDCTSADDIVSRSMFSTSQTTSRPSLALKRSAQHLIFSIRRSVAFRKGRDLRITLLDSLGSRSEPLQIRRCHLGISLKCFCLPGENIHANPFSISLIIDVTTFAQHAEPIVSSPIQHAKDVGIGKGFLYRLEIIA